MMKSVEKKGESKIKPEIDGTPGISEKRVKAVTFPGNNQEIWQKPCIFNQRSIFH